jgi:Lrp/AsnC family transcriptional regulator, regulator for asnA, asnC and gidA
LDRVDRQLVRALQTDGRQSNTALARQLGLSESAVRRRIDSLLDRGVMRVTAVADPLALGLGTHAVIGLRVEQALLEAVSEQLAAMGELSYVYETIGQFDIIVVGFFPSDEELRVFLTQKLARLPGIVRSDTYHIMRTIKRSLRWGEASDAAGSGTAALDGHIPQYAEGATS